MSSHNILERSLFNMLEYDLFEQFTIIRQSLAPLRLTKWQMTKSMVAHLVRQLSTLGMILTAVGALIVGMFLWNFFTRPKSLEQLKLPIVGGSYQHKLDFQQTLDEGATKYPDTPYIIKTQGLSYVVYPSALFEEVKRLPSHVASAQDFFNKVYFGAWTTAGKETPVLLKTIGVDLARSIPIKVTSRQEDTKSAADAVIGDCPTWKEVQLFPAMMRLVSMTNACSFVGRELGKSEKWLKLVERFPMAVMGGVFTISVIPRILQPLLAPLVFLPAVITRLRMKRILASVVGKDMEQYLNTSDKKSLLQLTEEGKVPFTAALMSRYKPGEATLSQVTDDYVIVTFESTPSTAATFYSIMNDLASNPELIEVLRQELREVVVDGKLPKTHLGELRKMDSVMRESSRTNPFSLLVLYRLLRSPTKLSIGPTIPAGTIICVDAHHIHNSAKLWSNPEKYDGLRYHELRKEPGKESRYQFASLGAESPGWGDGSMACPGRLFANSTIKIGLAHLIMNYDFKFAEGETRPAKVSLPNGSQAPGLKTKFLFKSRKWDP
ncbi:hypothetical protein MMC22_001139 [Lobaria immixta]|nr:hypothetical protein [Lobaria immixta]